MEYIDFTIPFYIQLAIAYDHSHLLEWMIYEDKSLKWIKNRYIESSSNNSYTLFKTALECCSIRSFSELIRLGFKIDADFFEKCHTNHFPQNEFVHWINLSEVWNLHLYTYKCVEPYSLIVLSDEDCLKKVPDSRIIFCEDILYATYYGRGVIHHREISSIHLREISTNLSKILLILFSEKISPTDEWIEYMICRGLVNVLKQVPNKSVLIPHIKKILQYLLKKFRQYEILPNFEEHFENIKWIVKEFPNNVDWDYIAASLFYTINSTPDKLLWLINDHSYPIAKLLDLEIEKKTSKIR